MWMVLRTRRSGVKCTLFPFGGCITLQPISRCVAVCCSVLQRVAVSCSVESRVPSSRSSGALLCGRSRGVLQCVAACCSVAVLRSVQASGLSFHSSCALLWCRSRGVLRRVAACCSVSYCDTEYTLFFFFRVHYSTADFAMCCSVL